MVEHLTRRQSQIYEFIARCIRTDGRPPTIMEIARHFAFSSPTTVTDHLKALERKGFIERSEFTSRGIRLCPEPGGRPEAPSREIPIIGRVAAGEPILAEENIEGAIGIDASLISGAEVFALRVEGESMTGAGIMPGDYAFVRRQPTAEDGEIVVALLDGDATVKRLKTKGGKLILMPENPAMKPISVAPGAAFEIVGKVVGVFRRM